LFLALILLFPEAQPNDLPSVVEPEVPDEYSPTPSPPSAVLLGLVVSGASGWLVGKSYALTDQLPSTKIVVPVMRAASSDAKKITVLAHWRATTEIETRASRLQIVKIDGSM